MIGLGAGGHAKVVLETLAASAGTRSSACSIRREELAGTSVHGVPVLGDDELLGRQYDDGVTHAFIGLGGSGDTRPRRRLYELARSHGFEIVSVRASARGRVAVGASSARGATVFAAAVVNADAALGEDVIVNTGAIVEHDCRIGDHVHVASGARLASAVTVGDGAHVGLGASVIQGVDVGAGSIVGAGAAVVRDVEPGVVVAGVPARVLRRVET